MVFQVVVCDKVLVTPHLYTLKMYKDCRDGEETSAEEERKTKGIRSLRAYSATTMVELKLYVIVPNGSF